MAKETVKLTEEEKETIQSIVARELEHLDEYVGQYLEGMVKDDLPKLEKDQARLDEAKLYARELYYRG